MEGILFSKSHEWVQTEGNKAKIGLTDYAQQELGDIVYVNMPEVGADVECGKPFTDIESVKAVSEVNSPVCGKIIAVNEVLADAPEGINENPYESWIIEVELTGKEDGLLTREQYDEFVKTL